MAKSNPIKVTATILNNDTRESFYEFQFIDKDGETRTRLVSAATCLNAGAVVRELVAAHADLDDLAAGKKWVTQALKRKAKNSLSVTARSGHTEDGSFVYPGQTFGPQAGKLIYQARNPNSVLGKTSGTVKEWKEGLSEPCKHSDYLILGASISFASALLSPRNTIGTGALFHLHGPREDSDNLEERDKSSSGKTLTTRVSASATGSCHEKELLPFRIFPRALEEVCYERNNVGIQFDERGGALAKQRMSNDALAYTFVSGQGDVRSEFVANSLPHRTWSEFGMSNGEIPIDQVLSANARQQGEQVRMIGVPVPGGAAGGIFNRIEGSATEVVAKARELAELVETTISQHYGVAMPEFLKHYVPNHTRYDAHVKTTMDTFVRHVGADTNPWERRFAEKFGAVLAAAIFAANMGIAPWDKARAIQAIRNLYKQARSQLVSVEQVTAAFVALLEKRIDGKKRFPVIAKGAKLNKAAKANAFGAIVKRDKGRHVLVPLTRVSKMIKPAAATDAVLRQLADEGIVLKASNGKTTQQPMITGLTGKKRPRYVVFDLKALKARE